MMISDFDYTPMMLSGLEQTLSLERLSTYKKLAKNNLEEAIKLHVWNTLLSKELYGSIQGFEIVLRNALNNQLSHAYGDNWFNICRFQNREAEQITNIIRYLHKMGKSINSGNIVATISLRFWTGILDRLYENNLWRPYLRQAFNNAHHPIRRKEVFAIVDRIRRLRNRIAHHEPILTYKLDDEYQLIYQVIGWINSGAQTWIQYHNGFEEIWKQPPI